MKQGMDLVLSAGKAIPFQIANPLSARRQRIIRLLNKGFTCVCDCRNSRCLAAFAFGGFELADIGEPHGCILVLFPIDLVKSIQIGANSPLNIQQTEVLSAQALRKKAI